MGTIVILLVCAGLIALAVRFISRKNKANIYRNQSYKVRPTPLPYSPSAAQTRKEAAKTTTLNTYADITPAKKQEDDSGDVLASALVAAAFFDSPTPAANTEPAERTPDHHDFQGGGGEFGGAGASGSWDNDCSTDHSSDSSSCDTGSSYDSGGYDSGGGFDSGGGDSGGGGSD